MKEMHPVQELAIQLVMMLRENKIPVGIGMAAMSMALVMSAREVGLSKEDMLSRFEDCIDTIEKDTKNANNS